MAGATCSVFVVAAAVAQGASPESAWFAPVNDPAFSAIPASALGAAWGDINGDDRPDLAFAMVDGSGGILLGQTASVFQRVENSPIGADSSATVGVAFGDYENDGDLDLLKANYSDQNETLFRNDGVGGFTQVQGIALVEGGRSSQSVNWIDYNRDGVLDAFVLNGGGASTQQNQLYRGRSDGGFDKILDGPLVSEPGQWLGAVWGDVDGDGRWDVYLGHASRPMALFRSIGNDQFERVIMPDFEKISSFGFSGSSDGAWGDMDNDGDLDLAAATSGTAGALAIFRNDGGSLNFQAGSFVQGSPGAGFGVVWADFNNDGFLDVLGSNRNGATILLRGNGDGTFVSVNEGSGPGVVNPNANAFAVADYDRDGHLDVLVSYWPNGSPVLYRNQGSSNGWLRVRLVGTSSPRQGIGAIVRVETHSPSGILRQIRSVGGEDPGGSQEAIPHFGVGQVTNVSLVRVEWPSGVIQTVTNVAARQTLVLTEPSAPVLFSPAPGSFLNSIAVTLRSSAPGTEIHFTLDGAEPVATSPTYSTPIQLTKTTTIKARLFLNGFPVSEEVSAEYTADPGLAFLPPAGLFTNKIEVAMSSRLPGVEIHFTLDGSDPTLTSETFQTALEFREAATIKARAFFNGFPVTEVVSATYLRVYAFDNDGIPAAWREQYFGP
ncbi:MAG: VCBS repeat-containing protein, partial [Verrucomicrobiales bacterium]|nr:VCBS repeat-containing protein [Verrucomicrobiales bacterium]